MTPPLGTRHRVARDLFRLCGAADAVRKVIQQPGPFIGPLSRWRLARAANLIESVAAAAEGPPDRMDA